MSDKNTCPIKDWLKLENYKLMIEGASLEQAGALIMSVVKKFIVSPILNSVVSAAVVGMNMYEAAVTAANDLINSISPTAWMAYAVSNSAKEIYDICHREATLLSAVVSVIDDISAESPKDARYKRISIAAVRNIKMLKDMLESASNADEFKSLLRFLNRAISIANSNYHLLSADAVRFMRSQSAVDTMKSAHDAGKEVKEGKIKISDVSVGAMVAKSIEGASAIIRANVVDELDISVRKIASIGRILYMYTGVDVSRDIITLRSDVDALFTRLEESVGLSGDKEYHVRIGETEEDVDDTISKAAKKLGDTISNMTKKITKKKGIYMLNTSPMFNTAMDIYSIIDSDSGYLNGMFAPSDTVSAMLDISPYSNANNNTLTIYGSNLKLPVLIETLSSCSALLIDTYKEVSGEDVESSLEKIKESIRGVSGGSYVDVEGYEFDDSIGMSEALLHASILKTRLNTMKSGGVDRLDHKLDNDEYVDMVKSVMDEGVDKRIDEPMLGATMVTTSLMLLVPGLMSRKKAMEIADIANKRIKYLNDTKMKVSSIMNYRNSSCEATVSELNNSGLGFVSDALNCGKVAMGVISLSAGVMGLAKTMHDIIYSCVDPIEPDVDTYNEVQGGVKKLEENIRESIRESVDDAMDPLGFSMNTLDYFQMIQEEQDALLAKLDSFGHNID